MDINSRAYSNTHYVVRIFNFALKHAKKFENVELGKLDRLSGKPGDFSGNWIDFTGNRVCFSGDH